MESILIDTGVWYAAFDPRDPYFSCTQDLLEIVDSSRIVIPWPVMYETLRTRFTRNREALNRFEHYLKRPYVEFVEDHPLREDAMELCFESSIRLGRPLSMTDCLIRLMLDDINLRIDYLATNNRGDFEDLCLKRAIEILDVGAP